LEKYNEGIIATSACLGGVYAGDYWRNREEGDEAVLNAMRATTRKMQAIFGDRWYAEVQWNKIQEQHELNQYVIQIADEFGLELLSTVDCHYPTPDSWKDRELYKRLGYLGRSSKPEWIEKELPETVADMDYELYPKNGDEVWDSYKKYSQELDFTYDDDVILESIKRTHHIVHNRVEDFQPDTEVRLPDFLVPEGKTDAQALVEACIAGLKEFDLHDNTEYVDRLKLELEVIKERGFAKYFLTMKAISDKANSVQLAGPGRGSAAGSLVAYVLGITQIDPIKYGLLFSRFLRKDATDYPDIDYDVSDSMAL
jgi:DNA polymerase-3 subunit alpha